MQALVKVAPDVTALRQVPAPSCGPGEVVVRIRAAALCGTDLHIHEWSAWARGARIALPLVMGHEGCGDVVEVGPGVTGLERGDRVAIETHVPCGACWQCRHGEQHICSSLKIFGVHMDGCFADAARVPAICARKLPDAIPYDLGSVMEPLGTSLRAATEAQVGGATVVVLGCGPIGLFAVASALALGAARVAAVDVSPDRLAIARRVGAEPILDPARDDVRAALMALSGGTGVDAVIEASGSVEALKQSFSYLRKGGRMALVGLPGRPVELDLASEVIFKEARLVGIHGRRMFETWDRLEELLARGRLDVAPVLTHTLPLSRWEEGVSLARAGRACKVVFHP
jgi:threonine 3-dehydrogenase